MILNEYEETMQVSKRKEQNEGHQIEENKVCRQKRERNPKGYKIHKERHQKDEKKPKQVRPPLLG